MKTNTRLPTNHYVTKNDLTQALTQQTKNIGKILNNYVTKKDLEETLDKAIEKQNKFVIDMFHEMFIKVGIKFDEQDKRFDQVDTKFAQVDKRFKQIDNRFNQVDKRFKQIDNRFNQVDKRFEQIDNRFNQVDKRFEQIDQKFEQVRKDISESGSMIIDELKTSREEQTILSYRQSEHTDKFIELNNRVSTLESCSV